MAWDGWKREAAGRQPIAGVIAMIRADITQAQSEKGTSWQESTPSDGIRPAELRRTEILRLPKGVYSVRKDARTSTPHITITALPEGKLFSDVGMWWGQASHYGTFSEQVSAAMWERNSGRLRDPSYEGEGARQVLTTLERIANAYNYDRSDSMTDYFDTGFYMDVRLADEAQTKATQRAKLDVQLLRAALPEPQVIDLLVQAAYEQSWRDHTPGTAYGPMPDGDRLRVAVQRVRHERREGILRVPFDVQERDGWMSYSRAWIRSFKVKGKGGGEVAAHVALAAGRPVGAPTTAMKDTDHKNDWSWIVVKNSGFAHGRYQTQETIAGGWADSQEAAVYAAEEALGLDPYAEVSDSALGGLSSFSSFVLAGGALLLGAAAINRARSST